MFQEEELGLRLLRGRSILFRTLVISAQGRNEEGGSNSPAYSSTQQTHSAQRQSQSSYPPSPHPTTPLRANWPFLRSTAFHYQSALHPSLGASNPQFNHSTQAMRGKGIPKTDSHSNPPQTPPCKEFAPVVGPHAAPQPEPSTSRTARHGHRARHKRL